jgi:ABC-type nickel/cobalt efflux system permease component RcnA
LQQLLDLILSVQRKLQGVLAGYASTLFDSPERFALGMVVAVALGLVHALTPGHGKSVIFSYFLGQRAGVVDGMRIAAIAALTHGTIAVLLVLLAGRVLSPLGRPTGPAAWLEAIAGGIVAAVGALYVVLAVRDLWRGGDHHGHGGSASRPLLAVAMGLLPCPLTIIVVGAAVAQSATAGGIVLAAGISVGAAITIGCFGLLGWALRTASLALSGTGAQRLKLALGWLELATSAVILLLGLSMVASTLGRGR